MLFSLDELLDEVSHRWGCEKELKFGFLVCCPVVFSHEGGDFGDNNLRWSQ